MKYSQHRRTFLRTTTLAGASWAACGKGFAARTPGLSPCDRKLSQILRNYADTASLRGACVADRCDGDHGSGCLTVAFSRHAQYSDFLKSASESFDRVDVLSETDCHLLVDGRPYRVMTGEPLTRYGHDALSLHLSDASTSDPNGALDSSRIKRLVTPASATEAFHDITRLFLDLEEMDFESNDQAVGWLEETLRMRPSDDATASTIADRLVEATAALVGSMSAGDWQDLLLGTLVAESLVMSGMGSPVQLLRDARKLSLHNPDATAASVWLAVFGAGRDDNGRVYRALTSTDARMARATREALSDAVAMSASLSPMGKSGDPSSGEVSDVSDGEHGTRRTKPEISNENLVHYAMGIDKGEFDFPTKPALGMITEDDGTRHLRLSYHRYLARTDVRFEVQRATDLNGPWTADGITDEAVGTTGDYEFHAARTPVSGEDQMFMRLSIERVDY